MPGEVASRARVDQAGAEGHWLQAQRARSRALVLDFTRERCLARFGATEVRHLVPLVEEFVARRRFDRALFGYLGWLSVRGESRDAARACAALELLPTADDETAPVGELCQIWAGQMMRESGLPAEDLARSRPGYEELRELLAISRFGQSIAGAGETSAAVVLRRAADCAVRLPLEFGATLAGGTPETLKVLRGYGTAIGEALWFRDELRRDRTRSRANSWAEQEITRRVDLGLAFLDEPSQLTLIARRILTRQAETARSRPVPVRRG